MAKIRPLYLFCDNFKKCQFAIPYADTDHLTEERARARGWHVWHGTTMGGTEKTVVLCPSCVGHHRRPDPCTEVPGEQLSLEF